MLIWTYDIQNTTYNYIYIGAILLLLCFTIIRWISYIYRLLSNTTI